MSIEVLFCQCRSNNTIFKYIKTEQSTFILVYNIVDDFIILFIILV